MRGVQQQNPNERRQYFALHRMHLTVQILLATRDHVAAVVEEAGAVGVVGAGVGAEVVGVEGGVVVVVQSLQEGHTLA